MATLLDILGSGVHVADIDSFATGENFALEPHQLVSVKIDQEFDPVSLSLPISTATVVVRDMESPETAFTKGRRLSIVQDKHIAAIMFVDEVEQIGKNEWSVTLQDYVGILEDSNVNLGTRWGLAGGRWPQVFIKSPLLDISDVLNWDTTYNDDSYALEGFLPYTNKRDGVRNIAFAIGAAVLPDLSAINATTYIKVCRLNDEIAMVIPDKRVLSIRKEELHSNIKVLKCHCADYSEEKKTSTPRILYDATVSGPSERVVLKHQKPIEDDGGNAVEIIKSAPGYLMFSTESSGIIGGFDYIDEGFDRYIGSASDIENMVEDDSGVHEVISPIHVIDDDISTEIFEKCFKHLTRGATYHVKIATVRTRSGDSGAYTHDYNMALGDVIQIDTEEYGTVIGRVIRMTYNLTGGIIVKDVELKEIEQ